MKKFWMKQIDNDKIDCYCPVDRATGEIIIGLSLLTMEPPGKVIGEFWFENGHDLKYRLYNKTVPRK